MTANTSARSTPAGNGGGSVRTSRTRPESTFGTGQNTERGTAPARSAARVPGRLDARHAVDPAARRRGQPIGHLGLHQHEAMP